MESEFNGEITDLCAELEQMQFSSMKLLRTLVEEVRPPVPAVTKSEVLSEARPGGETYSRIGLLKPYYSPALPRAVVRLT